MAKAKYIRIGPIKSALTKHRAIVSRAADELGITRQSLAIRIQDSLELQQHVRDVHEMTMDMTEGVIFKSLEAGDAAMARWYAERKGKSRGYGHQTAIELTDESLERIIAGFGGDAEKLRAFVRTLDPTAES